jgi:hypothetical protein
MLASLRATVGNEDARYHTIAERGNRAILIRHANHIAQSQTSSVNYFGIPVTLILAHVDYPLFVIRWERIARY